MGAVDRDVEEGLGVLHRVANITDDEAVGVGKQGAAVLDDADPVGHARQADAAPVQLRGLDQTHQRRIAAVAGAHDRHPVGVGARRRSARYSRDRGDPRFGR